MVLNFESKPYGKTTSILITYGLAAIIVLSIVSILVLTYM